LREHGDERGLVRYFEASAARKVHDGEGFSYRSDLESAIAIAEKIAKEDPRFYLARLDTAIALSMASNLDDMEFGNTQRRKLWRLAESLPAHAVAGSIAMSASGTFLSGDLQTAKQLLMKASLVAEDAPLLRFSIACTAIPLALHLDDQLLLRRAARPRLLEHAFASNTQNVFGPVSAAVAAQLRVQQRSDEARALVTQAIRRLNDASNNIPLIVEAARCNATEALQRGLDLLAKIKESSRSGAGGWHLATAYSCSGQERRDHASRAAELFRSIPWKIYEAEALELAGDLAEALEIYRACGCVADVRRLESAQQKRTAAGLSKREYEVALLVAQGRSNKSIADELSLSERTIENHIASIFAKLSLRSRSEIAAYIAREAAQNG
jgi:DNA-binding NarL/FixJ family response regulator